MAVGAWTRIHVQVQAPSGVFDLWTWLKDPGRGSTYLCRPARAGSNSARGCRPLDVDPRVCAGPFRRVRPVYVAVGPETRIHVPVPALFCVFDLFTWLLAPGRGSTSLRRPFFACSTCARGCRPLEVDPRACVGPFPSVRHVHVALDTRMWINAPLPALFGVFDLCTRL